MQSAFSQASDCRVLCHCSIDNFSPFLVVPVYANFNHFKRFRIIHNDEYSCLNQPDRALRVIVVADPVLFDSHQQHSRGLQLVAEFRRLLHVPSSLSDGHRGGRRLFDESSRMEDLAGRRRACVAPAAAVTVVAAGARNGLCQSRSESPEGHGSGNRGSACSRQRRS
jgi:hypothetical protein